MNKPQAEPSSARNTIGYTIFDGLQWNNRRGLARFARQLGKHLEVAGWRNCPALHPLWKSAVGRVVISEMVEPYQQRRLQSEVAFYPHNVMPLWRPKPAGLRVLVLHDVLFLEGENRKGLGNIYRRLKLKHSLQEADLILTVSEASRVAIQKELLHDTPILVVPNSLAHSFTDIELVPKPTTVRPYTVLHFGGHTPSKNTQAVMEAVARLVRQGMEIRLEMAAMWKQNVLVECWRQAAGLPQSALHLLRQLSDEELIEAYRRADLHVMPSINEGFGIPVIEAARTGTLNVLSPIPVFREIMGDAAIYSDGVDAESIADALQRGLTIDRETFIVDAYERSDRYLFDQVHQNYFVLVLDHIASLVKTHGTI